MYVMKLEAYWILTNIFVTENKEVMNKTLGFNNTGQSELL